MAAIRAIYSPTTATYHILANTLRNTVPNTPSNIGRVLSTYCSVDNFQDIYAQLNFGRNIWMAKTKDLPPGVCYSATSQLSIDCHR